MAATQFEDFNRFFADLVRQRREEAGLTQQELADKIDVTRVTINKIENARQGCQLGHALRIFEIVGINLEDFD